MLRLFVIVCLFMTLTMVSCSKEVEEQDMDENCHYWAEIGECDKNPAYMLQSCAYSCRLFKEADTSVPKSLYDIIETDLFGNPLNFEDFKGKVIYVVNVASYCGYTEENYELLRNLRKYASKGLEIIIAPCNQFGLQEPGDAVAIAKFAKKERFAGTILAKADVNGPLTRPLFRFLKAATKKDIISW